jgi:hypothetical protein
MSYQGTRVYSDVVAQLLVNKEPTPLGPDRPHQDFKQRLAVLIVENVFAPQQVRDQDMAAACLAGLWLYHNFLDESHQICQAIETTTGSYWHGILHRREPDFENAKYWFRRVGKHAVFEPLHAAAREIASGDKLHASAKFLTTQSAWDPFAFVDLCEVCQDGSSPCAQQCRQIQQREWELLFDYCYRQAIGDQS